ncbi:MAG: hypothetical protein ThorAB25_26410, partial [Candidatus Thorarchaeota archaeon AB_25]
MVVNCFTENPTWNPADTDCLSNLGYSRDASSFRRAILAKLDIPF